MRNTLYILCLLPFLFSCNGKQQVDKIFINAKIYSPNHSDLSHTAFAIKDGKFIDINTPEHIFKKFNSDSIIDLNNQIVLPGLIDAHCHFYGYAMGLQTVNLLNCKSPDEIISRTLEFSKTNKSAWIQGRGWDQNLFAKKDFPTNKKLNELFPNTPVVLTRVDGHAALCNAKALQIAGITKNTKIAGGSVILENGELTGVLVDNAVDLVSKFIPDPSAKEVEEALMIAQKNCWAVGLTSLQDAGLDYKKIMLIDSLQKYGNLKQRLYIMIQSDPTSLKYFEKKGPIKSNYLNVASVKVYADGALGSRGACLIRPYSDRKSEIGFLLNTENFFDSVAHYCVLNRFQMNTHCIGDSANRSILNIYAKNLKKTANRRWRIEHCQVVNPEDLKIFRLNNIIPSVQFTHATSDMNWAGERLGAERLKQAYTYKALLDEVGILANGSDFPVENINPIYGFYAGVFRKDLQGNPKDGFQMENALSRQEALKAMTLDAAFAAFEEKEKGSIERDKLADFIIIDRDIMTIDQKEIPNTKVLKTYVGGKLMYSGN